MMGRTEKGSIEMKRDKPRHQGESGLPPNDIRERVRAARTLIDAQPNAEHQKDMELEAFMGLFYPELQRDRAYMRSLKKNRNESKP
jgi:hypothetical protein